MDNSVQQLVSKISSLLKSEVYPIPFESFKNSLERGYGIRCILPNKKAFRLNWVSPPFTASNLVSVDVWDGSSRDPIANIHLGGNTEKLFNALPELVNDINSPEIGSKETVLAESLSKRSINEAARKWTPETITSALLQYVDEVPNNISKSDFASLVGFSNSGAVDILIKMYPDSFENVTSKRYRMIDNSQFDPTQIAKEIEKRSIKFSIGPGGKNETYGSSSAEESIPEAEKRPYVKQLEDIKKLVGALAKGAYNSLFLTGGGGVGKTFSVEKQLHDMGLSDGNGYYKQTGTTSAAGLYATLFRYQKSLILFDDCDTALADQESRNVIKAASDTKKVRKLSWGKRSNSMYDPEMEEPDEEEIGVTKFPNSFEFRGQVLFISNLPVEKLDPDGALRSRSFVININPSREEVLEQMENILYKIELEDGFQLSDQVRREVFEVIKRSKKKSLSIRTLVRALGIAASNMDGWESIVELYA